MSLNDSILQGIADFDILHRIVHGLPADTVSTEGGVVPTISKVIAGLFERVVAAMSATSTTPITIDAEGDKIFSIPAGKAFHPGHAVIAYAGYEKFIAGVVTSYNGTQLIINPTLSYGTGSASNWTIGLSGPSGPKGDPGKDGKDAPAGTGGGTTPRLFTTMPWEQ